MSRLSDEIKAVRTGRPECECARRPRDVIKGVVTINDNLSYLPRRRFDEYVVEARFGAKVKIPEGSHGEEIAEIVGSARRAIVEAAFGEFRGYLAMLRIAILERDLGRARKLVQDLEEAMFN